ncbi:aromatic-ring hydroxylase C-terminal domain-containing protein [Streptomyces misionensis]
METRGRAASPPSSRAATCATTWASPPPPRGRPLRPRTGTGHRDGEGRLAELARNARPLLLDLTEDRSPAESPAEDGAAVDHVGARRGPLGRSGPPARPDGHAAWAIGSPRPDRTELADPRAAVRRWFRP